MLGRDFTYFHPTLCLDPHFIVTGHTNDHFCTDELQIVDVKQALHNHLRRQGFDAVIFLDLNLGLHCYDEQSYYVLMHGRLPRQEQRTEERTDAVSGGGLNLSAMQRGPLGRAPRMRRRPTAETPAAPQRTVGEGDHSYPLNRSRMNQDAAWVQLTAILQHTDARFALVLNNMEFLANRDPAVMNVITQLQSFRTTRHSVIVYLFRDAELANLSESARNMPLYTSVLRPRIEQTEAGLNRMFSIRTPNAAEVRNLLNHIRLRPDRPYAPRYRVAAEDIEPLAIALAASCCRKDLSLNRLLLGIEDYFRRYPQGSLSLSDWQEVTGETDYRPPMERLEAMVGLEETKEMIRSWYARMNRRQHRSIDYSAAVWATLHSWTQEERRTLPRISDRFAAPPDVRNDVGHALNVRLLGNPGTGKTTVAGLLGELYYDLGLLPQGHTVPVTADELISDHVGGTAIAVHRYVMQAMGGVLFIDEAYALAGNAHGREAFTQLIADMSRYEGQFAVVIAGYPREIAELLALNEGADRRFPTVYELPDYTWQEMRRLLEVFLRRAPEQAAIAPELAERLDTFCENWVNARPVRGWGNAGEAQNLVDAMLRSASVRMERTGAAAETLTLTLQDMPLNLQEHLRSASNSLEEAIDIVRSMTGLNNVKEFLYMLCNNIRMGVVPPVPGNYIFYGPPGTGKTTVAHRMGELLFYMKILPSKRFREIKAQELLHGESLERAFEAARGGVLFIDEAHQLADTAEGQSIIKALVPLIEAPENHNNTCVICAGYAKEMQDFLNVDKGLRRRFPEANRIRFENYTPHELRGILEELAQQQGDIPEEGYLDRSEAALSRLLEVPPANFGNAGYLRDTYLTESRQARQERLVRRITGQRNIRGVFLTEEQGASVSEEERRHLTAEDIPKRLVRLAGPAGQPALRSRDAWTMVDELYGKDEIVDYIRSLRQEESGVVFQDAHSAGSLHIALSGPNGSGRHTVAYTLAKVWKALGLLETADFTIANRGNLVAGYVGQTPEQARSRIDEATGGTLIVEYPSALLPAADSGHDFGPEALSVLAGAMSRSDLSVILIDSREGLQRLFQANTAFQSRLARQFALEEPDPETMERLFRLQTEDGMVWEDEMEQLLPDFFLNWVSDRGGTEESVRSWGGGAEVSRLAEQLRTNWQVQGGSVRTEEREGYTLRRREITADMLPQPLRRYLRSTYAGEQDVLQRLDALTGLARVKCAIHRVERSIRFSGGEGVIPGCYCFLGNPGTGKTKVARMMGQILRSVHALEKGHVIERTAQQLCAQPERFEENLKLARDGVLFIDEAHQLARSAAGLSVIRKLLTALEDMEVKRRTCIILAGYPKAIMELLGTDSGLKRRFGTADSLIVFDDYTPEELLGILRYMAAHPEEFEEIGTKNALTAEEEFLRATEEVFLRVYANRQEDFGNAGFVRNYLHDALCTLQERLDNREGGYTPEEAARLTGEDIPERYRSIAQRRRVLLRRTALRTDETHTAEQRNALEQSTVYLEGSKGEGSGAIITEDGYVLTCSHVVRGNEPLRARVYTPNGVGGDYRWFDCEVVEPHFDDCDMALLKLDGVRFMTTPLRPQDIGVTKDEETRMLGYPLGKTLSGSADTLSASLFEGRVSAVMTVNHPQGVERCYLDGTGLHGNSGSPVFSQEDGRMIGVFSGSILPDPGRNPDEMNYFYPIHYFWERFVAR